MTKIQSITQKSRNIFDNTKRQIQKSSARQIERKTYKTDYEIQKADDLQKAVKLSSCLAVL